jgi:putative ABC transport system substrate-binding protein
MAPKRIKNEVRLKPDHICLPKGVLMKRRDFITLLGGAAAAWPLAARAQQPQLPVIGFLSPLSPNERGIVQFRRGLEEAGYVPGQNVVIEFRWANGQLARLPELAADLVRRRVAVIVASGASGSALAAKAATSTIPIVVAGGADPVRLGLVASLNHPGGNITGVTSILNQLAGKRLSLLSEFVPQATTFGYLVSGRGVEDPEHDTSDLLAAARAHGWRIIVAEYRPVDGGLEAAFAALVQQQVSGLVVSAFPLAINNRQNILTLAARHKIPAIYPQPVYAREGGLMSYFGGIPLRQVALDYVSKILKGANPADLPIMQPTKFELVINLKTAKTLGLTVPPTLLAIADEVIE